LFDQIPGESGLDKSSALKAVDVIVSVVTTSAMAGDGAVIIGLGQLMYKDTPERQGRKLSTAQ